MVDQVKICRYQPHRIRVDQQARAQSLLKQPQKIKRILQKFIWRFDRKPVVHNLIICPHGWTPAKYALKQGLCFGVTGLERGKENPRELAHACGMAKIFLHENFNAAPAGQIPVAHTLGDLNLQIKAQLVGRTACDKMKMASHRP